MLLRDLPLHESHNRSIMLREKLSDIDLLTLSFKSISNTRRPLATSTGSVERHPVCQRGDPIMGNVLGEELIWNLMTKISHVLHLSLQPFSTIILYNYSRFKCINLASPANWYYNPLSHAF